MQTHLFEMLYQELFTLGIQNVSVCILHAWNFNRDYFLYCSPIGIKVKAKICFCFVSCRKTSKCFKIAFKRKGTIKN